MAGVITTMSNYTHTWAEPGLYILADEELIESSKNAIWRLCPIEKAPDPVIVPDQPWEGGETDREVATLQDPFYANVLYDPYERIFRCWYRSWSRYEGKLYRRGFANQDSELCYAISEDGINWEKPIIGQVLWRGSADNNMIRLTCDDDDAPDNRADAMGSVIPIAQLESEDRFASSVHSSWDDPIYPKGVTVCFSPDGINWRMHYPPVLPLDGDCNSLMTDPVSKCYLMTSRSAQHGHLAARWGRGWKRHIALSKSRDLIHWTPMLTVIEADEQDPEDTQLYKMQIVPYGHAYLGLLLVFRTHEMVLEDQLVLSRDLMNWQRVGNRQPLLTLGSEGSWDSKHVTLTGNPPHPEGDKLRWWYGGANAPHYQAGFGALGTGTQRQDGFACWEAGDKEGVITTVPFRVKGATTLTVNVDAAGGEFRAEVIDKDGKPIEHCTRADCIPITGDRIREVVNFKAGPGLYFDRGNFFRFPGQDVRYRFYLRNAKLYAFKSVSLDVSWPKSGGGE